MSAHLARLIREVSTRRADEASDAELLTRVAAGQDKAAFELLVRRHAEMVWKVCRRVTRDHHAAEDAFQAAFLALARRAGSVRAASAAGWLHRVAYHAALKARPARRGDPPPDERPSHHPPPELVAARDDLGRAIHAEVDRLPDRYRLPVVLCHLEGCTQAEAAARLGWPEGTVATRLRRGCDRLRGQLARTGLGLPAAGVAAVLSVSEASALPRTTLAEVTRFASGSVTPGPAVAGLTSGALTAMKQSQTATLAAATAVLVVATGGLAWVGVRGLPSTDARAAQVKPDPTPRTPVRVPPPSPPKVAPVSTELDNRLSVFLSSGTTGSPGRVVQFDWEGGRIGEIDLHEAPNGMAAQNGTLMLAIATPMIGGGEILAVRPDGTLSRPRLDRKLTSPIGMGADPATNDVIVTDNDALLVARVPAGPEGKVTEIAKVELQAAEKHFPGMSVAMTKDGHVILGSSDPEGVYRFKPPLVGKLGKPVLPKYGAVAADLKSNRWVAVQDGEIRVFDGDKELAPLMPPPGTILDTYKALAFGPDGQLVVVLRSGKGTEVNVVEIDREKFRRLFVWDGQPIKCVAVGPRMKWAVESK